MIIAIINALGFYTKAQVREAEELSFKAAKNGWDKETWFIALDLLVKHGAEKIL